MSNLELLDRIAGNTMCDILGAAAPSLIGAGIWALPSGYGTAPAVALMGLGGASYLASNYLCEPIDVGGTTPVPGVGGCQTVDGYGQLEYDDGSGWRPAGQTGSQQVTGQAISIVGVGLWGPGANGEIYSECEFTTVNYGTVVNSHSEYISPLARGPLSPTLTIETACAVSVPEPDCPAAFQPDPSSYSSCP